MTRLRSQSFPDWCLTEIHRVTRSCHDTIVSSQSFPDCVISVLSRLLLPVMLFAAATRRTAVLYLLLSLLPYLHYRYTATQQGGCGGLFCHTCLQGGGEDQRPFAQSQTKRIHAWCVCVREREKERESDVCVCVCVCVYRYIYITYIIYYILYIFIYR